MGAEAEREAYWRSDADAVGDHHGRGLRAGRPGPQRRRDRARTRELLLRKLIYGADEQVGVAAAQLARLLDLDPAVRLQTVQGRCGRSSVDPSYDLAALMGIALLSAGDGREERGDWLTKARWKEERWRPWLPTLSAGYSPGEFGGGSNRAPHRLFRPPAATTSTSGPCGLCRTRARQSGAAARTPGRNRPGHQPAAADRRIDQDEVAEAYGLPAAPPPANGVRNSGCPAEAGFREELIRTHGGVGLPIEVVNSLDLLPGQDAMAATVQYDQAEFRSS